MLDWLWDAVGSTALQFLAEILILLLALAAAYAVRYLSLLNQRQKQDILSMALGRLSALAQTVVLETESTVAASLRQAVADGKVSRDELVALGNQAARKVLMALDEQTRRVLQESFHDLYSLVRAEIEARLQTFKAEGVISSVGALREWNELAKELTAPSN